MNQEEERGRKDTVWQLEAGVSVEGSVGEEWRQIYTDALTTSICCR